jgi:hypothetical protein
MTVPALALANFQYKRYIDNLTEEEFNEAKDFVTTKWYGVFEMWEVLPEEVKLKKRDIQKFIYLDIVLEVVKLCIGIQPKNSKK